MKRDMGRWVVFSGGYTEPIQMASGEIVPGRGKGIGVCAVDAVSGRITCSAMLPSTPNPSHLTTTSDGRFLYCVSELKEAGLRLRGGGGRRAAASAQPSGDLRRGCLLCVPVA